MSDSRFDPESLDAGQSAEPSVSGWVSDNQAAWDQLAAGGHVLARPAEDHLFADPLRCVDAPGWLGPSIRGWRVLCLAAGGGRQGPLYAAAGGVVTVVDLSDEMLQLDRQVASQRKLDLATIQTEVAAAVDDATEFAKAGEHPSEDVLMTEVYADGGSAWRN